MQGKVDTWRSRCSRRAIILLVASVSALLLYQLFVTGNTFLRRPNQASSTVGRSDVFSLYCQLNGVGNRVMVGLPVCKLEYMNVSLTLWNKYKEEDNLYLLVDRQLRNQLGIFYSNDQKKDKSSSRIVEVDCNDWEILNSTLSACRQLEDNFATMLKNGIDEIWIWNVENVILLHSPALLVKKIRKTPQLVEESSIWKRHIDSGYSALVDTNDGHSRWLNPLVTTLKMDNASRYIVEGFVVQALVVHSYVKHWNMFYSQRMKNLSWIDAQIAYIYRQLITEQNNDTFDNQEFQTKICSQQFVQQPHRYSIQDRFTVLLSTFNREQLVQRLVRHYQENPRVHRIFVLWHNPLKQPSEELLTALDENKTSIVAMPFDSLNNRFLPLEGIETKAVLICDDDMFIDHEDILYAFQIWNDSSESLTGFFPRAHRNIRENEYEYVTHIPTDSTQNKYSIMLTKIEFMKSEYLFWYYCAFDRRVLQWIRDNKNCEDIAMQMMVSGLTGAPPIHVEAKHIIGDYGQQAPVGEQEPISFKPNHYTLRGECIGIFSNMAFQQHAVLIYNDRHE
ncbi:Exostosin-like 2 [Galdieria sulphuraria]|nr:Exostosin-like 2 [Galdieria sulphuraria]